MPYIGNPPAEKYASYDVQHITTSATSSYVLDKNVANENEIRVVLNNVIQQPGSSYAYTASGNTLTLSAATTSSDKLYVVFTGKAVQTVTPPPSSVGLAQFNATGSPGTNTFLRGDNSWATPSDTSLTLNNNGANKIIAGTATTNTMSGQTNLIYNGNRMGVGGAGASADLGDGIHIKTADAGGGSVDANGSELVIENSTNAGITILTPNSSKGNIYFADPQSADIGVLRYDHSDNSMRFVNNGLENFRIVSTGNVGIGEPSPLGKLHVRVSDTGASVNSGSDALVIEDNSGDMGMTLLSSTSGEGRIAFGDSGGNSQGQISYAHNGDSMRFYTAAAERMRMDSSGRLLINNDDTIFGQGVLQVLANANETAMCIQVRTNSERAIHFANASGVDVGDIVLAASSTAYNTSSDYRLKENEVAISDGIARLKQLKPYRFNFKADADTTVDGFFAHEVTPVVPEAISGTKDAMHPEVLYADEVLYTVEDELPDGMNIGDIKHSIGDVKEATKINPQSIDQSKLVPLLTSALQEAITEIESLKTRLTTLENA